jgi:hypothetical protein
MIALLWLTFRHRRLMCSSRCENTILFYLREFSMHGKRLCSDHTRQGSNSLGVFACYCLDHTAANLLNEGLPHRPSSNCTTLLLYVQTRITPHSERPSADRILTREPHQSMDASQTLRPKLINIREEVRV